MVFFFQLPSDPFVMRCTPDRTPAGRSWYDNQTTRDRNAPIEEWMKVFYPSSATVTEGALFAWGRIEADFCLSKATKEIIEALEPETHQFLPLRLVHKDQEYEYFILKFGRSMDVVDVDQSDVQWHEFVAGGRTLRIWLKKPTIPLRISKERTSGFHLWQTNTTPDLKFMSTKLRDALREHDALSGIVTEKQLVA